MAKEWGDGGLLEVLPITNFASRLWRSVVLSEIGFLDIAAFLLYPSWGDTILGFVCSCVHTGDMLAHSVKQQICHR